METIKLKCLVFLLLPFLVFGKELRTDLLIPAVPNGDITVTTSGDIILNGTSVFSSTTATTVPFLNASKELTSSAVTPTELGYVSGVTSAIQTQIDSKLSTVDLASDVTGILPVANGGTGSGIQNFVDLTTAQSIAGDKDFTDKIEVISTTKSSVPCPSMTNTQRDLIGAPDTGSCVYSSDDLVHYQYDGTDWVEMGGGGAGGSRLNLLEDGSFEKDAGVTDGATCGGSCSLAQDGTVKLTTPNNAFSLDIDFSAAAETFAISNTPNSEYSGVSGILKGWAKTSAEHEICAVINSIDNCITVNSNNEWNLFEITFVFAASGDADFEIRSTDATDINIDEVFIGAREQQTIATENITDMEQFTPTLGAGVGTATLNVAFWRRVGDKMFMAGTFTTGTVAAAVTDVIIPGGYTLDTSKITIANTTASDGQDVGKWKADTADQNGSIVTATGTATDRVYFSKGVSNANPLRPTLSTSTESISNNNDPVSWSALIPIEGWESSTKYAIGSCDGLACFNEFSAKVASAGTVSGENLDFINGNCSFGGGQYTCPVPSGIFTTVPNCTATLVSPTNTAANMYLSSTSTTTSLNFAPRDSVGTSGVQDDFEFICQRSGDDFNPSDERFIKITNTVTTPGSPAPKLVSAKVSATEVITEDESGFISSCTNADPSVCTLTGSFFTNDPKCWADPDSAGTISTVTIDTAASVTIDRTDAATPFTLFCHGE